MHLTRPTFLILTVTAAMSTLAVPRSHTETARESVLVATTATQRAGADVTHTLELRFHDGYTLNTHAPASRRLVLTINANTTPPERYDADDFTYTDRGATLTLHNHATTGDLTALLCRVDRCRRVTTTVKW